MFILSNEFYICRGERAARNLGMKSNVLDGQTPKQTPGGGASSSKAVVARASGSSASAEAAGASSALPLPTRNRGKVPLGTIHPPAVIFKDVGKDTLSKTRQNVVIRFRYMLRMSSMFSHLLTDIIDAMDRRDWLRNGG